MRAATLGAMLFAVLSTAWREMPAFAKAHSFGCPIMVAYCALGTLVVLQ